MLQELSLLLYLEHVGDQSTRISWLREGSGRLVWLGLMEAPTILRLRHCIAGEPPRGHFPEFAVR